MTGSTPDGLPLAFSRAPAPDIAPWVQSLAVADLVAQEECCDCQFFANGAAIRVLMGGKWEFETADGLREFDTSEGSCTLYFGPQTKAMRVRAEGPIRFLMLQFHPGAPPLDQSLTHEEMLDRIDLFGQGPPQEARGTSF